MSSSIALHGAERNVALSEEFLRLICPDKDGDSVLITYLGIMRLVTVGVALIQWVFLQMRE